MRRLALNVSANLLSNVWATLIALLLTPWYVRLLGVESYGLIGFYTAMLAVLGILDTGISATAVRQIAWLNARETDRQQVPSLLRTLEVAYWSVIIAISVVLSVLAWRFGAEWFDARQLDAEVLRQALLLMCISVAIQVPSGLYIGGLMGLQRQVECSALIALFGTVRAVGAVAVLMAVQPDVRMFFMWQIVASVLQTGFTRRALWKQVGEARSARFSPSILRSVRDFAGGMTLITALSVVATQADKVILTRLISLEAFGAYALAWAVASGLSRIATPLIQAFSPRFTELVATGEFAALTKHLRAASQITSALILPPAALLVVLPEPILLAWIGDPAVAAQSAPLLRLLVIGTVLSASAYPALSVLYSRHQLRVVMATTAATAALLLPAAIFAAQRFGATGAAVCWVVNGAVMYIVYQAVVVRRLPDTSLAGSIVRDVLVPAVVAFAVAAATFQLHRAAESRLQAVLVMAAGLMSGWAATVGLCTGIPTFVNPLKWKAARTL